MATALQIDIATAEVADEPAYERYRTWLRTTYATESDDTRVWLGTRRLAAFANQALTEGDMDVYGRMLYCMRRLEEDWDVHVAANDPETMALRAQTEARLAVYAARHPELGGAA